MSPDAPAAGPSSAPTPEKREVVPFLPTPERVSQFFELDVEKVRNMYKNTEARKELVDTIMSEKEELSIMHDNISRDEMEYLVHMAGERLRTEPDVALDKLEQHLIESHHMLKAKHDFLEETSPQKVKEEPDVKEKVKKKVKKSKEKAETKEKKTLWQRVWDTITWLPRKHPIIFSLLAMAGLAWGLSQIWDLFSKYLIIPKTAPGAVAAAETLAPPISEEMIAIPQSAIGGPGQVIEPSILQPYTPPGGVPQPDIVGPLASPIEVPSIARPATVQELLDAGGGAW